MEKDKNQYNEEDKDLVEIISPTSLILIRKLARFGSEFIGADLYHLNGFAHYLLNIIGEKKVIKFISVDKSDNSERLKLIAENWESFCKKWRKFDVLITKAKGYWDKIENKKFDKINDKDLREYCKYAKYVPLMIDDLMALTIFMISKTSIRRMSIPSDAWVNPVNIANSPFKTDQRKVGDPVIHRD